MSRGITPQNSILIESSNLQIESLDGSKVSYFGDGEVLGNANKLTFTISQGAQPFISDYSKEYA